MTFLDWVVIGVYLMGAVTFALLASRSQKSLTDYYLASRQTRWWQSGLSTMATQLGAISFVSAPAFVAMKKDGGLKWLCYEFGVPLGILVVALIVLPVLHRGSYLSAYEYLSDRFDAGTRTWVSVLFQLGRGLATAVTVLAGGLIFSTALPITTIEAILIVGVVTVVYDVLGGLRVVILTDFVQMLIIILGIFLCGITAFWMVGWDFAWQSLSGERSRIFDFSHVGLTPDGAYSFWPMTLGGIFLYASYYGCDQSQVQRELSVPTLRGVHKSLLLNAFARFPVVLLYCLMGVCVGAVFSSPQHLTQVAGNLHLSPEALTGLLESDPDRMVPMFVLTFLPAGVVGLIFVGILSALMSSLDSSINSLSAVSLQDLYRPYLKRDGSEEHYLRVSKFLTVLWGAFCILAAIGFAGFGEATRQTTIVLINAVGSLLYGPILATFIVGMLTTRIGPSHIKNGILFGILANLALWRMTDVSWLWWNSVGFLVTVLVAVVSARVQAPKGEPRLRGDFWQQVRKKLRGWTLSYSIVLAYFFLLLIVALLIEFAGDL